jgi:hypothetical protein
MAKRRKFTVEISLKVLHTLKLKLDVPTIFFLFKLSRLVKVETSLLSTYVDST